MMRSAVHEHLALMKLVVSFCQTRVKEGMMRDAYPESVHIVSLAIAREVDPILVWRKKHRLSILIQCFTSWDP